MSEKWEGKSKGNITGHKIFVFILKRLGLLPAYFLLLFVSLYYALFAKSTPVAFQYFRNIHRFGRFKAAIFTYRNYFIFGQTLIDKVYVLSGAKKTFDIDHEGHENLKYTKELKKGAILLSAHLGNWEIAGQMLEILDTKFNVLMYDNEISEMKDYMKEVMRKRDFNIIPIKDGDMGHLVSLHKAFGNNEWVVMHGDRFRPEAPTIEKIFMGKKAKFPLGPFIMAAKFGVPIILVFSMKEGMRKYHFYAQKPLEVNRARTEEEVKKAVERLSDEYIVVLEEMLKKYPDQWFNFYQFWENYE